MALWKARSLSPEQKVQIVEEESEAKSLISDESGSFLGLEDVSMSEIHSCSLPIPVISLYLSIHTCTHAWRPVKLSMLFNGSIDGSSA